MDNKANQDTEVNPIAQCDQVVIEDYRGSAVLPPPALLARQLTAKPETKQESDATPQISWTFSVTYLLIQLGCICSVGIFVWFFYLLLVFVIYQDPMIGPLVNGPIGIVFLCIAIAGLILTPIAMHNYRPSYPRWWLRNSRIGLAASSLTIVTALIGYFLGW